MLDDFHSLFQHIICRTASIKYHLTYNILDIGKPTVVMDHSPIYVTCVCVLVIQVQELLLKILNFATSWKDRNFSFPNDCLLIFMLLYMHLSCGRRILIQLQNERQRKKTGQRTALRIFFRVRHRSRKQNRESEGVCNQCQSTFPDSNRKP